MSTRTLSKVVEEAEPGGGRGGRGEEPLLDLDTCEESEGGTNGKMVQEWCFASYGRTNGIMVELELRWEVRKWV